jgi:hypothetical protein
MKKLIFLENKFPEIYFLVVKYRVFFKNKTLIRQKKALIKQHDLTGSDNF